MPSRHSCRCNQHIIQNNVHVTGSTSPPTAPEGFLTANFIIINQNTSQAAVRVDFLSGPAQSSFVIIPVDSLRRFQALFLNSCVCISVVGGIECVSFCLGTMLSENEYTVRVDNSGIRLFDSRTGRELHPGGCLDPSNPSACS